MTDLPRKAAARTARLAALPLGYAGRNAIGFGKRLGGRRWEVIKGSPRLGIRMRISRVHALGLAS